MNSVQSISVKCFVYIIIVKKKCKKISFSNSAVDRYNYCKAKGH